MTDSSDKGTAAATAVAGLNVDFSRLVFSAGDVVFHASSHLEGFGTLTSDIDVYLIYGADTAADGLGTNSDFDHHTALFVTPNGLAVDIEPVSYNRLMAVAASINSLAPTDYDRIRSVRLEEINRYYRTAIGVPLYNSDGLHRLQTVFRQRIVAGVFESWCGVHGAVQLRLSGEYLADGRLDEAFEAARDAVAFIVDGYLAGHGEAFTSRKYRFAKLRRRFGESSPIFRSCWDLKSLGARAIPDFVECASAFCNSLGAGRFSQAAFLRERFPKARDIELHSVGTEHVLVVNRTALYRLDGLGATIWPLLTGQVSEDALASELVRGGYLPAGVAKLRLAAFLNDLERWGLCKPSYRPKC